MNVKKTGKSVVKPKAPVKPEPKKKSGKLAGEDLIAYFESQEPALDEYNGHPMINLEPDKEGGFGVKLGLKKVAAVLAHIDECRAFVMSEGQSIEAE